MMCYHHSIHSRSIILVVAVISGLAAPFTHGQAAQPATRNVQAIEKEFLADAEKMHAILPGLETLLDSSKRAEMGPKLIPILTRLLAEIDELTTAQPDRKEEFAAARQQFLMMKSLFGDKDATDRLQQLANSKTPGEALIGKSSQLMVRWILAAKDQAAQSKVADDLEILAKANPASGELVDELQTLSELGPASLALSARLEDLITGVMKNQVAEDAGKRIAARRKVAGLMNTPLVITGNLLDGKKFTTADWKGKVILVDFWATWCGPCIAELPAVKKTYADNHAKGLEIVGVSNDFAAGDLTQFLDKNKDMPWPQLFDPASGAQMEYHPVAKTLGIIEIPTMFLLDKKGVVRSVTAAQNLEDLIPKLIAE